MYRYMCLVIKKLKILLLLFFPIVINFTDIMVWKVHRRERVDGFDFKEGVVS